MTLIATITVRLSAGSYITSTVEGRWASSTQNAEEAAKTLGHKLGIADLTAHRRGPSLKNADGQSLDGYELWGSRKRGASQSGVALTTLLLVIAAGVVTLAAVGVVGLVLVFAGLIKLLGEME